MVHPRWTTKRLGIMYLILGMVIAAARLRRCSRMMPWSTGHGLRRNEGYLNAAGITTTRSSPPTASSRSSSWRCPLVTGLMNYLVPLQIGARDVSFPS